jgi:hypothetical protein
MYGLFYYSYDYSEWETLMAVSRSKKALKDLYKKEMPEAIPLFLKFSDHVKAGDKENENYLIKEVRYIEAKTKVKEN